MTSKGTTGGPVCPPANWNEDTWPSALRLMCFPSLDVHAADTALEGLLPAWPWQLQLEHLPRQNPRQLLGDMHSGDVAKLSIFKK